MLRAARGRRARARTGHPSARNTRRATRSRAWRREQGCGCHEAGVVPPLSLASSWLAAVTETIGRRRESEDRGGWARTVAARPVAS